MVVVVLMTVWRFISPDWSTVSFISSQGTTLDRVEITDERWKDGGFSVMRWNAGKAELEETGKQRRRQKRCVFSLSLSLAFSLSLIALSLVMHSLMHTQDPSHTHAHTQTGHHYHTIPWCICLSLKQLVGRILIYQMTASEWDECVCVYLLCLDVVAIELGPQTDPYYVCLCSHPFFCFLFTHIASVVCFVILFRELTSVVSCCDPALGQWAECVFCLWDECEDTMLNVIPATHTLSRRRSLAVDKNKPREAPTRSTNCNSSLQVPAPAGGNNQNQQQPPPDLVCPLLLVF